MAEDPAETRNLAADHRDRLIAMIGTWCVEAGKYQVMPIDGSGLARLMGEKPRLTLVMGVAHRETRLTVPTA